jgi:hypothetical protein
MKTLITTLALASLVAAPAFAHRATQFSGDKVTFAGKYLGQDPDPNVRSTLLRDAGSENH